MSDNKSFRLPSFAKINLSLRILGRRDDGFHELCTVFQTISLKDELAFRKSDEIILTCSDPKIPVDERNLVVRAAYKLRERYAVDAGAEIHLEKNIPAPGGFGGGSSNAAVALVGLARLWKLKTHSSELCDIGKTLGADVPFFFYGGTALGVGRGDEIMPLADVEETDLLVVAPDVPVATGDAFARLNAARLTNKTAKSILQICRERAEFVGFQPANLINDFERSVLIAEPEIARVKQTLLSFTGARAAMLSGSGAGVFAVFENESYRRAAFDVVRKQANWRVFAAQTVSRSEYQASLDIDTEAGVKF